MSTTTSVADLVAREQVATAEAAEGDGEVGPRRPVHDPRLEIHAGRAVDRDDRNLEVEDPVEQGGHRRPRCAARPGAEERVHRDAGARPRAVGRHLPHSLRVAPARPSLRGARPRGPAAP